MLAKKLHLNLENVLVDSEKNLLLLVNKGIFTLCFQIWHCN